MNKTSNWADEVDEEQVPERQVVANPDGTKTVTEHRRTNSGRTVRLTRCIRDKIVHEHVNRAVAERKQWVKFGAERGASAGPNISTTIIGEQVWLRLSQYAAQQQKEAELHAQQQQEERAKAGKSSYILCRVCRGQHFTAKCPYKDTLVPLEEITGAAAETSADAGDARGSYVPPHMRAGAKPAPGMRDRRDEGPTIRITNLSEYTQKEDVEQLCRPFGMTERVHVAKDRETQLCRGFAFVSFMDRESAERAIARLNGYGFDHLILSAEWSNDAR
ncbi:translation initiation factor eIF3 subunit g [Coemansia sp. RSA 1972]|nr:translation initiation factor eIF3 subunit g [Coemansia sp. RSA 1972]